RVRAARVVPALPFRYRLCLCFFHDPPTTEISTLSLHDALPISAFVHALACWGGRVGLPSRTAAMRLLCGDLLPPEVLRRRSKARSEEHTSELQSLAYLVCRLLLEKKKKKKRTYALSHGGALHSR